MILTELITPCKVEDEILERNNPKILNDLVNGGALKTHKKAEETTTTASG